jgi:hypothetical protein
MPRPRPRPSLRNRDRQPDASTTACTHCTSPIVRTLSQLAVRLSGGTAFWIRQSAGSMPSFSQILSIWTSRPNRGCGVPWPRLGPHGGLLVNVRQPRNC